MNPLPPPSARKFIAALGLIVGLVVWVGFCGWFGVTVLPNHWAIDLVFYPLAGLIWIIPAARLVRWSGRPKA